MSIIDNIQDKLDAGTIEFAPTVADGMTAYQIAKLLNVAIVRFGLNRSPVAPQYVYNLGKNGQIDGQKGSMTDRRFDDETVQKFIEKFVARNMNK